MKLDVSSLAKALSQLEKSLAFVESKESQADPELRAQFRAAAIQAFEYSYELATRMIRRQLEQIAADPSEVRRMTFKDMMREAADAGLIQDPRAFTIYREKRNLTSHAYEENRAEEVLADLAHFVADVRHLLDELKRRNK